MVNNISKAFVWILFLALAATAFAQKTQTPQSGPVPGLTGEYANSNPHGGGGGPWLPGTWIPDHRLTQIDSNINFSWSNTNLPAGGAVSLTTYLARWSGYITFPVSGAVNLTGVNANVTLGNATIPPPNGSAFDIATPSGITWYYNFSNVQAGLAYPITIVAQAQPQVTLSWTYTGQSQHIVPASAFTAAVVPNLPSGVNVTNAANNAVNINYSPVPVSPATSGYLGFTGIGTINYITPVNSSLAPAAGPYTITDSNLVNNQLYGFTVKALYVNPVTQDYTQSSPTAAITGVSPLSNPINFTPNPPLGLLPNPMTLPDWMGSVEPVDTSEASSGPSGTISVNMAYGIAVVDSGPDLVIGNPLGPDISFERMYRSAMAAGNLSSRGLPPGWTHNWDYRIVPMSPGAWGNLALIYPSGAWEVLTPVLSGGTPTGAFTVPQGAPYVVSGVPTASVGVWTSITISQNGLSKEVFGMQSGDTVYRLQQKVFGNGSAANLHYNGSFQLSSIDNGTGGQTLLTLSYGSFLNTVSGLTSTSKPNNFRNYSYANGELSSVSTIGGAVLEWTYQYLALGSTNQPYLKVATTVDPQNTASPATINYNLTTGRVSNLVDLTGNVRTMSYLYPSGSVAVTTPQNGLTNSYTYNVDSTGIRQSGFTSASGDTTSISYSTAYPNLPVIVTPPTGGNLTVGMDVQGKNPGQVKYPLGTSTIYTWSYPTYAPLGQILSATEYGKDGTNLGSTLYGYYSATGSGGVQGYLQSVTYPNGNTVSYTYTSMGNVLSVSDISGTVTYGYSNGGSPEIYGRPYKVTDPTNNVTQLQYDDAGRLTGVTDPMLNSASQSLNQYDQLTSLNLPLNLSVVPTYNVGGKPPTSVLTSQSGNQRNVLLTFDSQSQLTQTTDANSLSTYLSLDGESDLTKLVNGSSKTMHQFTYTPANRSMQSQLGTGTNSLKVNAVFTPTGSLSTTSLVTNSGTTIRNGGASYGLLDPDLPTDIWMLDSTTSWYSETLVNQYDAFGRLSDLVTFAPDGNSQIEHAYTYDNEGNVLTDSNTPTLLGNGGLMPTANYPQQSKYTYNLDGTRKQMVIQLAPATGSNIVSVTYNYGYDAAKRVTSIKVYSGTTLAPVSSGTPIAYANYTYDKNGNVSAARTPGATTFYHYNGLGQLDLLQNVTADGNPDPYAPSAYHVTDPYSGIDHTIFSSFTNFSYNVNGDRTGLSFAAWTNGGTTTTPASYATGTVAWGYDNGGRLTGESWSNGSSPVTYSHQYDNGGNLTTLRGYTLTSDLASDQLQSTNLPGYSSLAYNGAGEITSFNGATAIYSPLGQLSKISGTVSTYNGSSSYASSMVYDHLGRRAALSESLGTGSSLKKDVQFYIYDGNDLVYRQFTGTAITPLDSSDVTADNGVLYLNGPTGLIMEFDRFGAYRTLLFDPQGSNVSSTQGLSYYGGNITGTTWYPVFYDSYGSQVWIPANGSSVSKLNRATSQPFQYKGQYGYYTDGATGLNYCLNRYYDPLTGRWLSRDPSGLDGGVNVYAYVNGDPVLGADPSGLDSWFSLPEFGRDFLGVLKGYGQAALGVIKSPITSAQFLGAWVGNGCSYDFLKGSVRSAWQGFSTGITGQRGAEAFGETFGQVLIAAGSAGAGFADAGIVDLLPINEGVYIFFDEETGLIYVGQSGNITHRLHQHLREGRKFDPDKVVRVEELRGKLAREVLEQKHITDRGGIRGGQLLNRRNPIGKKRQHLMSRYP